MTHRAPINVMPKCPRGLPRALALGVLLGTLVGCQAPVVVLNLIGVADKPLTITSVAERRYEYSNPLQVLDPFERTRAFHDALGKAIHRSVVPDMCFEFQLGPNLALGTAQLADISPLHYARMTDAEKYPVLAVAADPKGRAARSGLLVVTSGSSLSGPGELRGKTVAFGPPRDARTHHAGLLLLLENSVNRSDLSLELFPVPGSLKTFPNAGDVLQSVLNNSSDAGFVDELFWDSMTDTSKFKVIGRTAPVVERLILRSPTLDDATADQISQFLMSAKDTCPDALAKMNYGEFQRPDPGLLTGCRELLAVDAPVSEK